MAKGKERQSGKPLRLFEYFTWWIEVTFWLDCRKSLKDVFGNYSVILLVNEMGSAIKGIKFVSVKSGRKFLYLALECASTGLSWKWYCQMVSRGHFWG